MTQMAFVCPFLMANTIMFPELGFTGFQADIAAANAEGLVSRQELDIIWANLDLSTPFFNHSDKIRKLSVFFFNPITGGMIDVEQMSDNGQVRSISLITIMCH